MRNGFTVIELLVTLAIIGILVAIAVPLLNEAMLRARVSGLAAESRVVYTAFKQYFVDQEGYPNSVSVPFFELDTFEPLVTSRYYRGAITSQLLNQQADAFDSPDDQGTNLEFWLEMTLAIDTSVRFLVADSDNAPLGGGVYRNGVFSYRNGVLTPIHEIH